MVIKGYTTKGVKGLINYLFNKNVELLNTVILTRNVSFNRVI